MNCSRHINVNKKALIVHSENWLALEFYTGEKRYNRFQTIIKFFQLFVLQTDQKFRTWVKRSRLCSKFLTLHLSENMCLSNFQRNASAKKSFLHFRFFIFNVGEGKLQDSGIESTTLPTFVDIANDINTFISSVSLNIETRYTDKAWISEGAVLATNNAYLEVFTAVSVLWLLNCRDGQKRNFYR